MHQSPTSVIIKSTKRISTHTLFLILLLVLLSMDTQKDGEESSNLAKLSFCSLPIFEGIREEEEKDYIEIIFVSCIIYEEGRLMSDELS